MPTSTNRSRWHCAGFSMLEMLATIGVIALLAGILFPALAHQKKKAKELRTRNDMEQLVMAWKAYATHYRQWPSVAIEKMDATAMGILCGVDTNQNPLKILFIDVKHPGQPFHDPWIDKKNPNKHVYHVRLDTQWDGVIENVWNGESVRRDVAVWSDGPDGNEGTADDVCSWK